MSGHSHWSGIKYKKTIADAQRSKAFSKLSREITVAVREGGENQNFNPRLRSAIEKAKSMKMPADNIERAIKRGTGEIEGSKLESVLYEALGPGGIAIIIEGITDNKNRAINEVKQTLNQNKGKLIREGSIKWMFEKRGVITVKRDEKMIKNKEQQEELELKAIEAGAEDVRWHNNTLDIYTKTDELEKVKNKIEETGIKIQSSSLEWIAKKEIDIPEKDRNDCQKLFEALDRLEVVQEIYSNLKN